MARTASTTLDVILERRIDDHWNIEGDRDLSDAWTGFTRFTIKTFRKENMVRGAADKKQTTTPDDLWPEILKNMPDAAQQKKVGYRKTEARQCEQVERDLFH